MEAPQVSVGVLTGKLVHRDGRMQEKVTDVACATDVCRQAQHMHTGRSQAGLAQRETRIPPTVETPEVSRWTHPDDQHRQPP